MPQSSAASQVYPHLPSAAREPIKQRERSLADALYPSLSKEAKQREADQALLDACCKRGRDNFLREWRETNANLRERRR
jgi:hypothetical protein